MNLALVCDVRLAAPKARFDTRFLQLGLHPGGGHTWMFRRIAGPQAVAATVLFGAVPDGPEAERVGRVWRCGAGLGAGSCRERWVQEGMVSGVAGPVKKHENSKIT